MIERDLFLAILAMDSYNRTTLEAPVGVLIPTSGALGDAQLYLSSENIDDNFFVQSYLWNGELIISYRGTDDPTLDGDILAGWITGGGAYMGPEAIRAVEFYNILKTDPLYGANITLTGHSLGGGLAGLVAAVNGGRAVMFDNMPFELAAQLAYDHSRTAVWDETGIPTIVNPAARDLYYDGEEPLAAPSIANIHGYAVTGEALQYARESPFGGGVNPLGGQRASVSYLDSHGGFRNPVDLHSQSLLVALQYANIYAGNEWWAISPILIDQLFNNEVALAIGIKPADQDGTADAYDKMMRMIAYSAIDGGERPYGDSGIRALFDDANEIGSLIGNTGTLHDLSESLAQIITQYAGTLAFRDDEIAAHREGVVTVDVESAKLEVDLTTDTWSVNGRATQRILGRETLLQQLDVGGTISGVARAGFDILYGAQSLDRIQRLGFRTSNVGQQPVILSEPAPNGGGPEPLTFFAGTLAVDIIQGSAADEIIYGGEGSDVLDGGLGKDLIIGGLGNDVLKNKEGDDDDVFIGGSGDDTVSYITGGSPSSGLVADAHAAFGDSRGLQISDAAFGSDTFFEVERINLTDSPDRIRVDDGALNIKTTIDMGASGPANILTNVDVIDYSNVLTGLNYFNGYVSERGSVAGEFLTVADALSGAGLWNKGLVVAGADRVILTNQSDSFIGAGRGTILETGAGADKVWFTPDVAVTDLSSTDRLSLYGLLPLYGGLRNVHSESPYALAGIVQYAFNKQGDLIVRMPWLGDDGEEMYLLNWKAGAQPSGGGELGPGNIFLGEFDIGVFNLLDPDLPSGSVTSQLQFLCDALKVLIGAQNVNDPLVLDLDGDGIELTSQSSASPLFDIDGDLFAERTGWVRGDDGMLALDANANGTIDSVRELFGSPGASGFAELATYDSNSDGNINNLDAIFGDLRVWQDLDGDGVTDAGELKTLTELGIVSINVAGTAQSGITNAGNTVLATGTFTRGDGSSGTLADIGLSADQVHTDYLGDKTISTAAAAQPELKGRGTLTDLRVAMTLDPNLITTVQTTLPGLNTLDLEALRAAALPILAGWAQAVKLPDANGTLVTVPPATHADLPVLVEFDDKGRPHVTDFAYQATDEAGTYWALASGDPIRDANGDPIARPVYQDVLDQTGAWTLFTGDEIAFMERYTGVDLPIDTVTSVPVGGLDAMSSIVDNLFTALNRLTIRLAIQGPLAGYFDGIAYDVAADTFHATTDRQLIPVYEAIFAAAPATAQGAADYLTDWKPLLDYLLGDFDRGADHLEVTYSYVFAAMVAAYESTGLATDITSAAGALGVPTDLIVTGTGTLTGSNDADIFYLGAGDQIAHGGIGLDAYVFGRNFGHDTIDDQEPEFGAKDPDIIRFADIKSNEVTATRVGLNLIITVIATGDTVTVLEQFEGRLPTLFGGDVSRDTGVHEIVFADGVVWDKMDIAQAVSHPLASDDTLVGTPDVDVLDGGAGTDSLTGGNDTDLYRFGTGYGHDTVEENMENVLIDGFDIVQFGEGLTLEDVAFRRIGISNTVEVEILASGDILTVLGQFDATYTGPLGQVWLDRIEAFAFEDGSYMTWDGLMEQLVADAKTAGDDTITGFSYEDTLDGGAGNDSLSGGNENDTYIFGLGYGNDTIHELETNLLGGEFDVVTFGAGVEPANLTLSRSGASNDLLITLSDGSTLTVQGQFAASYTGPFGVRWFDRIEEFRFQDGANTVWTYTDVMDQLIAQASTAGNDTIYGFSREDILDGGAGDDYLNGGNESDTYIFDVGYGADQIHDVRSTILDGDADKVSFGPGITTANIRLARDGNDLIVSIDGESDTLRVVGMFAADNLGNRVAEIESFHFDGGTVWTRTEIQQVLLQGTSGADTLTGFFSADTLDGGVGNDRLEGGDGGDTYKFNTGYGQDTIHDVQTSIFAVDNDKVVFGAGVTTANIRFTRDGDDLVISLDGASDTLTIEGQFAASNLGLTFDKVEEFHFADGTTWSWVIVQNELLQGTAGNDVLVGYATADTLDGGAGNDRLEGSNGGDTYKFDIGYGQDVALDLQTDIFSTAPDKIVFGPGVTTSNIRLSRSGNDLIIAIDGQPDTLKIIGEFAADNLGHRYLAIEEFHFADGTVWTVPTVQAKLLQGSSGNDTLVGFFSADTLDGGAGNDRLEGGDDGDTYVFGLGYGQDTVLDAQSSIFATAADKVQLGAGILPADVSVTRVVGSNDLVLSIAGTTDRLTILGYFNDYNRVEEVRFANGTVWNYATVVTKSLIASGGDDTIIGSSGADVIDGRAGNDNLQGAAGADRYLFGRGAGQDRITDSSGVFNENQVDVIEMAADVLPGDVSVSRPAGTSDLVLKINGTSDRVTIVGHFSSIYAKLEEVRFADGTVWNYQTLMLMSYAGTSADESLYGTGDNNTIDGAAGNDYMEGGTASDVYVFGRGYGQDRLFDDNGAFGSANIDAIQLGPDILPQDVILRRTGTFDLTLFIAGTSDRLTMQSYYGSTGYRIEEIRFANGTVWNLAAIDLSSTTGTAGEDSLIGNGGVNTLDGDAGSDMLDGSTGSDTYKFGRNYGQDWIRDSDSGTNTDIVMMAADVVPADVVVSRSGNHLVLRIPATGDRLTIEGFYLNNTWGVEEVRFDDGTIWNRAALTSMATATTVGDDSIIGTSAANTLDGGADNDYLEGAGGADTYVFGRGYGQDRIYDLDSNTANIDAISFLVGVASSDVIVSRGGTNGVDLILKITGTSDMLRVTDFFFNAARQIEEIRFNDGTVWTYATIVAKAATGGPADESIYGTDGVETLSGGGGNDYLEGRKGNDAYAFDLGSGQDRIWDEDTTVGNVDTIQMGAGILPSDIVVTRAGTSFNDVVIKVAGTSDRLTIIDGALNTARRVEQVSFADGTVWSYETLLAKSHAGTAGDDNLYGSDEANAFNGGAGNDYQEGRKGNDTYAFGCSAGQDRINDTDTTVGNVDAIVLGGDVAVADLLLWRSGTNNNDLTIQINGTSDRIVVSRQFESDTYRVEELRFADGTIWDANTIRAQSLIGSEWDNTIQGFASGDTLLGNAGNDSLFGNDGADTLDGGAGDDLLDGGLGNDIYRFGRGSGFDRVDNAESDSAIASDRVDFGANIDFDQLWLTQSGNDLLLNVIGGSDTIRIQNWYSNSAATVDAFRTTDGMELTEARVQALVSAMAAFSPPSGSDPDMPPDTRQQLDSALAAAWQPTT